MDERDARDVVGAVLRQIAPEVDLDTVDPTVELREQIDIDSMDFLNFVTGLHDRTGVDIPESDYVHVSTLGGCVEYLARRAPV